MSGWWVAEKREGCTNGLFSVLACFFYKILERLVVWSLGWNEWSASGWFLFG